MTSFIVEKSQIVHTEFHIYKWNALSRIIHTEGMFIFELSQLML